MSPLSNCHLVVNIGLAQVAPHRQVRKAQHHRVFRHYAVSHHVLVHIAATEDLRGDRAQVRRLSGTCGIVPRKDGSPGSR